VPIQAVAGRFEERYLTILPFSACYLAEAQANLPDDHPWSE
jgi:hypothetical protein